MLKIRDRKEDNVREVYLDNADSGGYGKGIALVVDELYIVKVFENDNGLIELELIGCMEGSKGFKTIGDYVKISKRPE